MIKFAFLFQIRYPNIQYLYIALEVVILHGRFQLGLIQAITSFVNAKFVFTKRYDIIDATLAQIKFLDILFMMLLWCFIERWNVSLKHFLFALIHSSLIIQQLFIYLIFILK